MEMARHRPIDWPPGKPAPHPMFLHSQPKWRLSEDIWFSAAPISRNQLHLIVCRLTVDFPELKEKILSKKTGRSVGIPHMEEAMVPWEYGMEVTGHRDSISCRKSVFLFFQKNFQVFCFLFSKFALDSNFVILFCLCLGMFLLFFFQVQSNVQAFA
jgi:hypothetical protein